MKIYVGCAIQGLPPEQWEEIKRRLEDLKWSLRKKEYEVLNFRSDGNRQAPEGTVFDWDYKQCEDCDAMIALALYPSTDMGMEMAFCLKKIPKPAKVLALAPRGNNTSRMVKECNLPGFSYQEFDSWDQIPKMFDEFYFAREPATV